MEKCDGEEGGCEVVGVMAGRGIGYIREIWYRCFLITHPLGMTWSHTSEIKNR